MRSVLVLEREYRVAEAHRILRPDELLQMFGRAGRRGMDERGTVLFTDSKPRLTEARPLKLVRDTTVDWPSLLGVIHTASEQGSDPLNATRELTQRLFSKTPIRLGLEDFLKHRESAPETHSQQSEEQQLSSGTVVEFQNSDGIWERKRATQLFQLKDTWYLHKGSWRPGLSSPKIVSSLRIGTVCKFGNGKNRSYGLEAPLANFPKDVSDNRLTLSKWLLKVLRERERADGKKPNIPKLWTLERIERYLLPQMPVLARGGQSVGLTERGNTLLVKLDYSNAEINAFKELNGRGLLNPIVRKREIVGTNPNTKGRSHSHQMSNPRSVAEQWFALGLIDDCGLPTRRGVLVSHFNHGEGLAVAAGLEEPEYPIEELLYDLANIRAGHRFQALALAGRPLSAFCQERYGLRSISGYLRRGLPEDYGDGASEILYTIENKSSRADAYLDDELSRGDIERAQIEWHSLIAHIATAARLDWDRWTELQHMCQEYLKKNTSGLLFENLPPLTRQQGKRTKV